MRPFKKKPTPSVVDEELRARNIKRARWIKATAGHYYDKALKGRGMSGGSVVVPAEVFLKIWDVADRLADDI